MRALLSCCTFILSMQILVASVSVAQDVATQQQVREKHTTSEFLNVKLRIEAAINKHSARDVLLVVDIDNTLLAMNQDLGSDQWFNWQDRLLKSNPNSSDLVAPDFSGLLRIQGILFSLSCMHPPEPDLPNIVKSIQDKKVTTVVLTSRGPDFRSAAERELTKNHYDFDRPDTVLKIVENRRGLFKPYDPNRPREHGLTAKEIDQLGSPRNVTYANGVFMTAGQHKGYMLRTLLARAEKKFKAIIYVDDHQRHTDRIHEAYQNHPVDLITFRYSREDNTVNHFDRSSKKHVVQGWNQLRNCIELVLTK